MGLRGDDTHEPGERGTANTGAAEEKSAEPGGENWVDGSTANAGKGGTGVKHCGLVRGDDESGAKSGADHTGDSHQFGGEDSQKKRGKAATEQEESVEKRRSEKEHGGSHAGHAFFLGGDPIADADFGANVEKEK